MNKFNFRGHNVEVTRNRVIVKDYPGKFVYGIRGGDHGAKPYTIEKYVAVNFWGQAISDTEIDLGLDNYIALTKEEIKTFSASARFN